MEMLSLLGFLGYLSIEDLRKRQIHLVSLGVAAIAGLFMHLYFERITIWSLVGGLATGMALYVVSVLSSEKIGKGDALLVGVTGIFLGFWGNLFLLWLSAILAAFVGIIAVVVFRKDRQYELPFIPFIFIGFIIYLIINNS